MTQPQISIRRATVADAEALTRLSRRVFPLGCPANTPVEDLAAYMAKELTPERFRAHLEDDRVVILVAEAPTGIAAYAHLARESSNSQVHSLLQCEVRRFYVDAEYHGRGVADALMTEALAYLGDSGAVWLSVFSENERAIAFYKRWKFQIVGTQYFLVGSDNQKDYIMLREPKLGATGDIQ